MIEAKAINHIGIAVRSIDAHRDYYENVLGARFEGVEDVPSQKVRVAFFAVGPQGQEVRLELLEPTSPESPVGTFLDQRGEGLHHVAYTVGDLASRLQSLDAGGLRLIDAVPRAGAHGMRIAFLHPKDTGRVLTELCEPAEHGS